MQFHITEEFDEEILQQKEKLCRGREYSDKYRSKRLEMFGDLNV